MNFPLFTVNQFVDCKCTRGQKHHFIIENENYNGWNCLTMARPQHGKFILKNTTVSISHDEILCQPFLMYFTLILRNSVLTSQKAIAADSQHNCNTFSLNALMLITSICKYLTSPCLCENNSRMHPLSTNLLVYSCHSFKNLYVLLCNKACVRSSIQLKPLLYI